MSALIKELEARKDDYILVADVINVLGNATNSAPNEVVKYLDAHNIDEHLTVFYMGENYNFYQYNGFLVNVGNDANTTYFRMSDVMAFEPITKHGIFKDGGNDHLNSYQKNLDDDYLTIDEVITNLNSRTKLFYSYDKVRDLARKKKITPCFYFSGYVCKLIQGSLGGLTPALMENPYTEIMTGYFTYRLLVEQIIGEEHYITLPLYELGNEILIYRLLERQGNTEISYGDGLALFESKPQPFNDHQNNRSKFSCIGFDEIRFSKRELDSYIASLEPVFSNNSYGKSLQDSELLTKLEKVQAENDDLNARLFTARNTYKQNQNEIKKLKEKNEKAETEKAELIEQLNSQAAAPADDNILQVILDESREDHAPDLKHAIQLWVDLYIQDGIRGDSHSSKANIWIKNNTNYAESATSSIGRIREIATPLKDFGAKRSREEEK
ncbi:coiled-coil domain-containing protein [Psychrobacter alimentarius]|uniref:coiled-coil domain-containing protein n=1 Tax=Psychrobacter alimentarius TaxID=261164 RepID=UPI003FD3E25B